MLNINLCFIFVLVTSFNVCAVETFTAKVAKIIDGDTIKVINEYNNQFKVRLAGIDCPERGQAWSIKAAKALKNKLPINNKVAIELIDIDHYGRLVGRIYLDGTNLNRYLVESGNCWAYPKYLKDKELINLQAKAKKSNLGLWSLPENERIEPWVLRKNNKHK